MIRQLFLALGVLTTVAVTVYAGEQDNIHSIKSDLVVPLVTDEKPAAGKRVRLTLPEYEGGELFYVLYLPPEWEAGRKYPVLVEFPGNGGYQNKYGDKSTGRVEDCKLGYGISGGRGLIWVCLPFVDPKSKSHALTWWGDPDATAAYCRAAVAQACENFGGDSKAVVLTGFSRGALACGYIGLRDDETAKLWRTMIAHSHFDGVRKWDYPESDEASARRRLARWNGRPLYVSQEGTVDDSVRFLKTCRIEATFRVLPYPNHTDEWVLKDIPERAELRKWLAEVLRN